MPISNREHLQKLANRCLLIVLGNSPLDQNDVIESLAYYGTVKKVQLTSDLLTAFVDFSCPHAPLFVAKCFTYYQAGVKVMLWTDKERISELPMPRGVYKLLPGCSMHNHLYLHHVPRSVTPSILQDYFSKEFGGIEVKVLKPDQSSRAVVEVNGQCSQKAVYFRTGELRFCEIIFPRVPFWTKAHSITFYAIPCIQQLVDTSNLFVNGGCEECNVSLFEPHADKIECELKKNKEAAHRMSEKTGSEHAPVLHDRDLRMDFPDISDEAEQRRWGIIGPTSTVTRTLSHPLPHGVYEEEEEESEEEVIMRKKALNTHASILEEMGEYKGWKVGDRCVWKNEEKTHTATIRWIGIPRGHKSIYAGVQYDEPVGEGTGVFSGDDLFETPKGYADLLRITSISPLEEELLCQANIDICNIPSTLSQSVRRFHGFEDPCSYPSSAMEARATAQEAPKNVITPLPDSSLSVLNRPTEGGESIGLQPIVRDIQQPRTQKRVRFDESANYARNCRQQRKEMRRLENMEVPVEIENTGEASSSSEIPLGGAMVTPVSDIVAPLWGLHKRTTNDTLEMKEEKQEEGGSTVEEMKDIVMESPPLVNRREDTVVEREDRDSTVRRDVDSEIVDSSLTSACCDSGHDSPFSCERTEELDSDDLLSGDEDPWTSVGRRIFPHSSHTEDAAEQKHISDATIVVDVPLSLMTIDEEVDETVRQLLDRTDESMIYPAPSPTVSLLHEDTVSSLERYSDDEGTLDYDSVCEESTVSDGRSIVVSGNSRLVTFFGDPLISTSAPLEVGDQIHGHSIDGDSHEEDTISSVDLSDDVFLSCEDDENTIDRWTDDGGEKREEKENVESGETTEGMDEMEGKKPVDGVEVNEKELGSDDEGTVEEEEEQRDEIRSSTPIRRWSRKREVYQEEDEDNRQSEYYRWLTREEDTMVRSIDASDSDSDSETFSLPSSLSQTTGERESS